MLRLPVGSSNLANIIGLDPGSDTFGFAVLTIDVSTMQVVESKAWTLHGSKLAGKDSWLEELYGNRIARIDALDAEIRKGIQADDIARRLTTIPGVGPIIAATVRVVSRRIENSDFGIGTPAASTSS